MLTIAGVLLIPIVQPVSQHWATNLILGGLFVFFALSLFGMYDIVLPSGLGRLTSSGEGRGGLIGVVFMALTFTVISFACVAPFYGGFIALSASASSAGDWLKLVLGAVAFSVTFALPFFVLALFPSLLKALPKKRIVAQYGQSRDGLFGVGRRFQVPPRRRTELLPGKDGVSDV